MNENNGIFDVLHTLFWNIVIWFISAIESHWFDDIVKVLGAIGLIISILNSLGLLDDFKKDLKAKVKMFLKGKL
jgi:hypothetical protein